METQGPARGCAVEGCEAGHKSQGYCNKHYQRFRKHGDPLLVAKMGRKSGGDWAPAPETAHDLICKVEDCDRQSRSLGYCRMHYQRFRKHGDPMATGPAGRASSATRAPRAQQPKKALSARELRGKDFEVTVGFPEFKPRPMPAPMAARPVHTAPAGPVKLCLVTGCGEPHKAYGYCADHLEQWQATGRDPGAPAPEAATTLPDPDEALHRQRERYEAARNRRLGRNAAR